MVMLATLGAGAHSADQLVSTGVISAPTLALSMTTGSLGDRAAKELLQAAKDDALVFATSNGESEASETLQTAIKLVQSVVKKEKGLEIDQLSAAELIVTLTAPQADKQESESKSIKN